MTEDLITKPIAVVAAKVRGYSLRVRTGIVLLEAGQLGQELGVASKNELTYVDYQKQKLGQFHAEQQFLGLNAQTLLNDIDNILALEHLHTAILLGNTDLALAYFNAEERNKFWSWLYGSLAKRKTGLLIAMPRMAGNLLPSLDALEAWQREERIGS
jgi:hypothetical protein